MSVMSSRSANAPRRAASVTRLLAFIALVLTVVGQQSGRAQSDPPDALPYSLGYTVTGDFAIGGVDLVPSPQTNGFQTGTIHIGGSGPARVVPKNAEILAAFLYWETLAQTPDELGGVLFRGEPVTFIRTLEQALTGVYAPCWSSSGNTLFAMRADVLSLLPPQDDEAGNPTGRRLVDDADLNGLGHTFMLPERGVGNQTPQSGGASLFVVYRNVEGSAALRRIVVYDGLHVQPEGATTRQNLRGFLQSVPGEARVAQIISRGAGNPTDVVTITGANAATATTVGNQFAGSQSPNSDRSWANPITTVTASMPGANGGEYGEQLTLTSRYTSASPYGCHTFSAIAFSTLVKDGDSDGLIDLLETAPSTISAYKDPNGAEYPRCGRWARVPISRRICSSKSTA